jgi:hypothetical protein
LLPTLKLLFPSFLSRTRLFRPKYSTNVSYKERTSIFSNRQRSFMKLFECLSTFLGQDSTVNAPFWLLSVPLVDLVSPDGDYGSFRSSSNLLGTSSDLNPLSTIL